MSFTDTLQFLFWAAAGIMIGIWAVFGYWRLRSSRIRSVEGDAPLRSSRSVIWREPPPLTPPQIRAGPGGADGAPAEPFDFIEEHDAGSQPCVSIRDSKGREWRVKWGHEVHTEVFGTRLAWALGYFAEPSYFISSGVIRGAHSLQRASACLGEHGRFENARFELSESGVAKHFDAHGWAWDDNPFVGTHELSGLKILMMLVSNWDNKDVRDVARGSNTAIFEYPVRASSKLGRPASSEARYLIIDWGAALGSWGNNVLQRGRWDPETFALQSQSFVTGVQDGVVQWGYQGQRTAEMVSGITVDAVQWFNERARRLTDDHLRAALLASGATTDECERFTAALRERLDRLREIAMPAAAA
jgi:hypothetical protein